MVLTHQPSQLTVRQSRTAATRRATARACGIVLLAPLLSASAQSAATQKLPARYFRLLEAGAAEVERRLTRDPAASLQILETTPGWKHFPYAILAPAVLYAKQHPDNNRHGDPKMLVLAVKIGDLLASEDEKGLYEPRLDSDWDTYMWLEAYRLLAPQLGEQRSERWKRAIWRNAALVAPDAAERLDFPWYNSPYIITSPNHYAQYASLLMLAGRVFGRQPWENLGRQILRRFAAEQQTSDGYWGEHSRVGPTTGYDHLTSTQVALYYEYSHDPIALEALRRSTDFHEYFTYPDGTPVEVINDRNRYWDVDAWGQFGFSNFPDGRRYAEFLTGFFPPEDLHIDWLGRLAQDALYYHEGPTASIPQDRPQYFHQMSVPAGIRKTGPWVVCLSGIVDTQAVLNQFYLDRQSSVSVFHQKLGLIISGANSKRQPELASFLEEAGGHSFWLPLSSRLQMNTPTDRLSLAYNTFFTDLRVPLPNPKQVRLLYAINRTARQSKVQLNLQLCLKVGEVLETSRGRVILSEKPVTLGWSEPGVWIRHHGWKLSVDTPANLTWPIHPYNPYSNGPETTLEHAVGVLSIPVQFADEMAQSSGTLKRLDVSVALESE
jgi:hypothetical protein